MNALNITLPNKVFIEAIKIAQTFNIDGYIKFNDDGILIQNQDPANVSINSILIKNESLIKKELLEDMKIFINFEEVYKIIKDNKNEDITLQILHSSEYINNKADIIYLILESFKSELKLLEEEREYISMPLFEHDINFKIDSEKFKEGIKTLNKMCDSSIFKFDYNMIQNTKNFCLQGINNFKTKIEYSILMNDITLKKINDSFNDTSSFSNEYLNKYVLNIITPDLKVFLSTDYPLLLIQENNAIKYTFILAPRIIEEEA